MNLSFKVTARCRTQIAEWIKEGKSLVWIKNAGSDDPSETEELVEALSNRRGWPSLTVEDWQVLVDDEWNSHGTANPPIKPQPVVGISAIVPKEKREPQTGRSSSWYAYRQNVLRQYMDEESIVNLQENAAWIVRRIEDDTRKKMAVKGLVFGDVQSGKTANMAAVMTMAADYRFNFFVILSGSIENLRLQTLSRLRNDLGLSASNQIKWRVLDFSNEDKKVRLDELKFDGLMGNDRGTRYATVCLKNGARLRRLIKWLYSDANMSRKIRLVIIDDEADQASINTKLIATDDEGFEEDEQERTVINELITNLANGRDAEGKTIPESSRLEALNYICYTATPYANVLNETSSVSLYPKDFICQLPQSANYLGVEEYFGNGSSLEGLPIIRIIPNSEVSYSKSALKDSGTYVLTDSLKDAICWFLCTVGLRREHRSLGRPITMLVHVSMKVKDHSIIDEAIAEYLQTNPKKICKRCKYVYERETKRVTRASFAESVPSYGKLNEMADDYPAFEVIEPAICTLLTGVERIKMDCDGELIFSEGIHLCCDNGSSSKWGNSEDHYRIIYPTKKQLKEISYDPAFIVVGGNTLSRGLTLEGLSCTYFERNSNQADTLMQMGRWFGYPRGYELQIRLWMSHETYEKFCALAQINADLKREIRRFTEEGYTPSMFAPRVMSVPSIKRLRITAKNKMQMSSEGGFDYSGFSMETTRFDKQYLYKNEQLVCNLIKAFADAPIKSTHREAYYWANVDFDSAIRSFIASFLADGSDSTSKNQEAFLAWMTTQIGTGHFSSWTVACAGTKALAGKENWTIRDGMTLGKVQRNRKPFVDQDSCIDIGSLRDGFDALCDVELQANTGRPTGGTDRSKYGKGDTPILLLYRIDKNSQPSPSGTRLTLGTSQDIYGYAIVVPTISHNAKRGVIYHQARL